MRYFDFYRTQRSVYLIDTTNKRYYRMPIEENPRNQEEYLWMTENMTDGVWHNLEDIENAVKIVKDDNGDDCLQIRYAGSIIGLITSPVISKVLQVEG